MFKPSQNRRRIMGYPKANPTPPRDLELLVYFIKEENEKGFIEYYNETISMYLEEKLVKDVVVWRYKLGDQILFVFATSPTVPPWFDVAELERLKEFADPRFSSEFKRLRDLDIHLQENVYLAAEGEVSSYTR